MRRLVKPNQQPVHKMGGDQDKRQRQPKPTTPDHPPERDFGESEREHKGLECDAAHVMLFVQLGNAFGSCRYFCHFSLSGRLFASPARGKCFPPLS